jgi:hypothetical protein
MSILASSYAAVGASPNHSNTKYVAVDPTAYQGTWSGQYGTGKKFSVTVSNVQGFKASAKFQDDNSTSYQQVLIKDGTFRVGDSKFVLQSGGTKALVATAVTSPISGDVTLQQGYATRS